MESTVNSGTGIRGILEQRNEIQKLLSEANAKNNLTRTEDEMNWVAPGDRQTQLFDFSDFDINTIKLGSLFATAVTKTDGFGFNEIRRIDRRLFHFTDVVQLEKSVVCPLLSDTLKLCNDRALYMSFHAVTGYDFTAEFESIYNGFNASTSTTSYANNRIVCWRALLAADSTLSDDLLTEYVDYILRITAWESKMASEIADLTLKKQFPKLAASGKAKAGSFVSVKVYIGKDEKDDKLFFWVRICPPVVSSMTTADVRDKKKGLTNNDINEEKKYEALMKFCYYRKYAITAAAAESLSGFSDAAASAKTRPKNIPPPPPPKLARPSDLRLYLLCHSPAPNSGIESVTPSATPKSVTSMTPRSGLATPRTTTSLYDALDYDSSDEVDDHQVVLSVNHNHSMKTSEQEFYYWGPATTGAADDDTHSVKSGTSRSSSRSNRSRFYQYADSASGAAVKPVPLESSSTAELLGWGENMYSSLGLSTMNNKVYATAGAGEEPSDAYASNLVHEPVNIPLPAPLLFERIKMVACSSRHTLLLTAMGFVYGCGENSEGALGTGDLISRSNFTMLLQLSKLVKKTNKAKGTNGALLENDAEDDDDAVEPQLNEEADEHKIIKISAGAGVIGAHSMALDSNGNLYGWGVPYAVGSGNVKPALEPTLINASFPTSFVDEEDEESVVRPEDLLETSNRQKRIRRKLDDSFVVDVSCGSCFTVAVMKSGVVASWGMWSYGRLGLGPIPYVNDGKRNISVSKKSKKIAKYKLRPAYIDNLRGIAKVSCGDAHVLCMSNQGELYTWGRNNNGQLGIGCSVSGYLIDLYTPLKVPQFSHRSGIRRPSDLSLSTHAVEKRDVVVKDICCGSTHSLVLDSNNDVWSWGHCGHPCLGHGDSGIEGAWSSRINGIFSGASQGGTRSNGSRIMIPYELIPWCQEWSQPRKLLSLYEINVVGLSAGEDHSMFVSDIGQIFLCGTGPVVPPFITNSYMHKPKVGHSAARKPVQQSNSGSIVAETVESKESGYVDKANNYGEEEEDEEENFYQDDDEVAEEDIPFADRGDSTSALLKQKYAKDRFNVVSVPRCPSSSWLPTVCTRRFVHIASAGHKCFAIQDEEFIVPSLTSPLLRMAREAGGSVHDDDVSTSAGLDDTSVTSSKLSSMSMSSTSLASRGRVDCVLISSGRVNLVHRALLAQRSGEIRDLILSETSTEEDEWMNQPTQLLMPELHKETANALVHYLYTDTLPKECLGNISLLYALSHVATDLHLNRLKVLCDNLLSTLSLIMLSNKRVSSQDYEDDEETTEQARLLEADMRKNGAEMPPTTLARDLGALIGDPQFADVRFIVEGKSIYAHRFILENRSEFFKRMFRSQMSETQHYSEPTDEQHLRMLDVTVPGSFVGFLRLLLYMYTSTLPDGSDAALLEDLETANRFCIPSMKILCENMLYPTKSNWKDLLYIAEALDLQRVKLEVLIYLRDNFDILISFDHDIFSQLSEEFPGLLSTILEMRCKSYPTPPSYKFIQHVENSKIQTEKENSDLNIPWMALGSLVVFSYLYQHAIRMVSIGPLIPIINSMFILGLLFYAYTIIRKQWKGN